MELTAAVVCMYTVMVTMGEQVKTSTEAFTVDLFQAILMQRANSAGTGALML